MHKIKEFWNNLPFLLGWGELAMDRTDRILLTALQDDARLTIADLAERAALTASPCWRRVKALEDGRVIRGYRADLDPQRLGYDVTVFVSVMLENHRLGIGQSFENAVQAIPEIIACHNVSGRYDFLLEVVSRDLESFGRFSRDVLRDLPGVKEIYSSFSLRAVKADRRLPISDATA